MICIPSETLLDKTSFPCASGYQLMLDSGLEIGLLPTSPLSTGNPSVQIVHVVTVTLSLCVLVLLCLESLKLLKEP